MSGFKSGGEHHLAKGVAQAKKDVLEKVRVGVSPQAAMIAIGKKPDTIRQWMVRDPLFAAALEEAKEEGSKKSFDALGVEKESIPFAEFSKMFFDQTVFPHHQNWIDLLEGREPSWVHENIIYEPGESNRLLINVPPEHAKSTVVTVNYPTYRIALNPNIRIIVVSKTITKAREFVYAIKQRLSHPRWLKLQTAYGPEGGWKQDADTWRTDTVYLGGDARNSSEKDPTIQALGMGGQIYGARADLIILDDCITTANAHEWESQINWLQKEVITRLGKNGKLLVVGTRIAANDLYKELRNPSTGLVVKLHLLIWVCLLYWNMQRNPKTGSLSGKSRMSRGMGILRLLKKTASTPSGMGQRSTGEEVKSHPQHGHLSTNKKTSWKTQYSRQYLCKERPMGCASEDR
jgi:hypothetical protein